MDLALIEMDTTLARQKAAEYHRAVRERRAQEADEVARRHAEEDHAMLRGYRELARGRRLIRLSDTLLRGGTVRVPHVWNHYDPTQRTFVGAEGDAVLPALAVMRADRPWCWVGVEDSKLPRAWFLPWPHYRGRRDSVVTPPMTGLVVPGGYGDARFRAIVPSVPPALRPRHHLRNYFILWEAEWVKPMGVPVAPRDPALLQRIMGDLFVVLAVWDLTDLERAVLGMGRARA